MKKDIGDDVYIGQSATPFQSVGKSVAIDKTASDFGNANLKVKKLERLSNVGFTMQMLPAISLGCWTWSFKE